jgi:hypothetical protein
MEKKFKTLGETLKGLPDKHFKMGTKKINSSKEPVNGRQLECI